MNALDALRQNIANNYARVERIIDWMRSGRLAVTSFTEGPERQLAYEIERLIQRVQALETAVLTAWRTLEPEAHPVADILEPHVSNILEQSL